MKWISLIPGSSQLILMLWLIFLTMAAAEKAKKERSCSIWLLQMAGTCRQWGNYCHRSLCDEGTGGRKPMAILILNLIKLFHEGLEHRIAVGFILKLLEAMEMLFLFEWSSRISQCQKEAVKKEAGTEGTYRKRIDSCANYMIYIHIWHVQSLVPGSTMAHIAVWTCWLTWWYSSIDNNIVPTR